MNIAIWYGENFFYFHVVFGFIVGVLADFTVWAYRGDTYKPNPVIMGFIGCFLGPVIMVGVCLYNLVVQGWYDSH